MAFFDRFTKRWASTGVVTEPSAGQADAGFAHLGANPPTVEEFNALFQWLDDKDNWLYRQLVEVIAAGGQTPASGNNATTLAALRALFGGTGLLANAGYVQIPVFIGGTTQQVIFQWGGTNSLANGNATITFPIAFPTSCAAVLATEAAASGWGNNGGAIFGVSFKNASSCVIRTNTWNGSAYIPGASALYWFAIGY
jgi:hypothetical protein